MDQLNSRGIIVIFFFLICSFGTVSAESGVYDRFGIITEHGLHGAVPEENIDLFTGNLTLKNLDIRLPGPNGFDLNIWRVYNSKVIRDRFPGSAWGIQQEPYSWVGFGWSMHMGRLHYFNTQTPVVEYPDGRWETAYANIDNSGYYITRDFLKLDKSNYVLHFKDGTRWTFGETALLNFGGSNQEQIRVVTRIENPYGHHIDITYDGSGSPRMSRITDSVGRNVNFYSESQGKLTRIEVRNSTGGIASYNYTVGEFNGDYFKLIRFQPPEISAVAYEYGNGLTSNWELVAVNTSYGGRMEYAYAEHTFYYQVYALQTRVVSTKRNRFAAGGNFQTWNYTYPSYQNTDYGTVEIDGPVFNSSVTYNAYTAAYPWKVGLTKSRQFADGSSSEVYQWADETISNTHWIVLNIDMGQAAAPLQSQVARNIAGDSDSVEEFLYERSGVKKYGLPTKINSYTNGSKKSYKTIEYEFESNSSFKNAYMLSYLCNEISYNNSNGKLKETQTGYFSNGAIDWVKRWKEGTTYLTWNYSYTGSNPNFIIITIDLPGSVAGTETYEYRYGVLSKIQRPGYIEVNRSISSHDSSVLSETNQHGGTMIFTYDNLGRITRIGMPSGFNDISAGWNSNSVTITQGSNVITKYWDGMGRDTGHVEQGDGITLYYRKSLDSEGRVISESKGSTSSSDTYSYELTAAGQVKKITDPRGKITNIAYSGDQKTVTDPNSHATRFEYDHFPGLVTTLTDAKTKSASYSYDGIGRLLSTTFNSNRTQSYAYNGMDQVSGESHPETGLISFAYNGEGNLSQRSWGGKNIMYTYNSSNQLLTQNLDDETITYSYDSRGRLASVSSSQNWSRSSISFNALGSVTQETQNISGLNSKTLSYSYSGNNILTRIEYPDGKYVDYTNNGLNMTETVGFSGTSLVSQIAYGINKQPVSISISGNGTSYSASYNGMGFINSFSLAKGNTLLDASYGYDNAGNITSISSTRPSPSMNATFGFDELNRLTSTAFTSGIGRVNNFSYSYDPYGNMLSVTEDGMTAFSASYSTQNRIGGCTYDNRGNLTSSSVYNYSWDNQNRLSGLTEIATGESQGPYLYNERGLRLKATRLPPSITVVSPNGGEVWAGGSMQSVTWTATGVTGNLNIEYSTDSGVSFNSIVANTPNDGSHDWVLPTISSANCLIRISEADGSPSDVSNASFTIETVSIPAVPAGPISGSVDISSTYTASGSSSGTGHAIQYDFEWGDRTHSGWLPVGATAAARSWSAAGNFPVKVRARCSVHNNAISEWSSTLSVAITSSSTPDSFFNSPSNRLILPEAIWASASGGGTWISEVMITDVSGGSVVSVYFNYGGGSRRGPFTLWTSPGLKNSVKFSNLLEAIDSLDNGDFAYLGRTGAVEFFTQDSSHHIQACVRNVNGNYSKTYPTLADTTANTADVNRELLIQNLANNARYRDSLVLFNPGADSVSIEVKLVSNDGAQITSINRAMTGYDFQVISAEIRAFQYDNACVLIKAASGSGRVMAVAATGNNFTNDPAVYTAVQVGQGFVNSPSARKIFPEGIWASAAGNGTWVSEALVTDITGGSVVSVYFNYGAGNCRGPFIIWDNSSGGARKSIPFSNLLQTIDNLDNGDFTYFGRTGAVEFITQDTSHLIHVSSRHVNGDCSKTYPALSDTDADTASIAREMLIQNIENNTTYRPSICLFNPSGESINMDIKLVGSDGTPITSFTRNMAGFDFQVISTEIRAMNYSNGNIYMRPTSGNGRIVCVGATGNNFTNDPAAHIAVQSGSAGGGTQSVPGGIGRSDSEKNVNQENDKNLFYSDNNKVSEIVENIEQTADIEITSPNGGEKLIAGSLQTIRWKAMETIQSVTIEYSHDNGSTFQMIVEGTPNSGAFEWLVPADFSDHCLIRISAANGQNLKDKNILKLDFAFKTSSETGREKGEPQFTVRFGNPQAPASVWNFLTLAFISPNASAKEYLVFSGISSDIGSYESFVDKWHRAEVQLDLMRDRGSVFLDGEELSKDIPLNTPLKHIFSPHLTMTTNGRSSIRIDDAQVYWIEKKNGTAVPYLVLKEQFDLYEYGKFPTTGGWRFYRSTKSKTEENSELGFPVKIDNESSFSRFQSFCLNRSEAGPFTVSKPIDLPKKIPFAVSFENFSIVRDNIAQECSPVGNGLSSDRVLDIAREIQVQKQEINGKTKTLITNQRREITELPAAQPSSTVPLANDQIKVSQTGGSIQAGGTPENTYYLYSFDGKLLAEYNHVGVCVKDYIYLCNKLLAEYQPQTAKYYYYASDQINTTRIVTDDSGTIVHSAAFDPYGGVQKLWQNTYDPKLKFSGKERELGSELDYFGARYYDHRKYRFLSVDPMINKSEAIANPQLWNLYAFCKSNPINVIDLNGEYGKDVHYYLTKYLALQAGFSGSDAEIVAFFNQYIDENPYTSATNFQSDSFSIQKKAWHFASDEKVTEVVNKAFSTRSLSDLGAALHCLQDSLYAHRGYRKNAHHIVDSIVGKKPDNTISNPEMALQMAQHTFDILNVYKGGSLKKIDNLFLRKVFTTENIQTKINMLNK